jgi:uncharacterized membrane protein YfhO
MKEKEFVFYRESFFQSALSDIFSFGLALSLLWFNHFYLGDHWFVTVFFLIIWVLLIVAYSETKAHRFTDKNKLKEYLDKELNLEEKS